MLIYLNLKAEYWLQYCNPFSLTLIPKINNEGACWLKTCQQLKPLAWQFTITTVKTINNKLFIVSQGGNMSCSCESRPQVSWKQQTKMTFLARVQT